MPDKSTQTGGSIQHTRDFQDIGERPPIETNTELNTIIWLAFDGASRGNPGPSGCGAHASIRHNNGKTIPFMTMKKSIPPTTNNMAEWKAFVYGLEQVCETLEKTEIHPSKVDIRIKGDSRLVVEQTCRRWKIKDNKFVDLFQQAHFLLGQFGKWSMTHVYRQQNATADKLANQAIQ